MKLAHAIPKTLMLAPRLNANRAFQFSRLARDAPLADQRDDILVFWRDEDVARAILARAFAGGCRRAVERCEFSFDGDDIAATGAVLHTRRTGRAQVLNQINCQRLDAAARVGAASVIVFGEKSLD